MASRLGFPSASSSASAGSFSTVTELPALSPTLDRLRAHVLEHSVKTGDFVLKSGARSSWFLDTKQTACRADGIIAVTDAIVEVFGDELGSDRCDRRTDARGGPDGVRRRGGARNARVRAAQLQRAQGSQAGRRDRSDRRCAPAGRPGAGHRGHHHARARRSSKPSIRSRRSAPSRCS